VKGLFERDHELAAVEKLLERRTGVLAIEAGVGIGKTSLVRAACQRAQKRGYDVLTRAHPNLRLTFHSASCGNCSSGD
jgi:hypothetical protein